MTQRLPNPQAVNFGTCWSTPLGQDLSMPSVMASGVQVVIEAILRRWSTPAGGLIDDPNYGYSLVDLVSDDLTPTDIQHAQQQLAAEATKDERVRKMVVKLVLAPATGMLTVTANGETAAGPFKFVLEVSAVTTRLLLVSP